MTQIIEDALQVGAIVMDDLTETDTEVLFSVDKLTKFAELQRAREWISVDDKLPDYGVEVIAMESDGNIYRLCRRDFSKFFWDSKGYYYSAVTHWTPLPPQTPKKA
jgi:hypothetical protein